MLLRQFLPTNATDIVRLEASFAVVGLCLPVPHVSKEVEHPNHYIITALIRAEHPKHYIDSITHLTRAKHPRLLHPNIDDDSEEYLRHTHYLKHIPHMYMITAVTTAEHHRHTQHHRLDVT